MRIKKYVARSLKEATEQMKRELGPNAFILNSRKVHRGGALSFLGKDMFEVTAALDEGVKGKTNSYARPGNAVPFERYIGDATEPASKQDPVADLRQIAAQFEQRNRGDREHPEKKMRDAAEFTELRSELADVKGTLRDIADQLKYSRMPSLPDYLRLAYQTLVESDVDQELAADLVQSVYSRLTPEQLGNKQTTETALLAAMAALIRRPEEHKARGNKARVIALVGPTGVGKTTTVAKLAAISKLINQMDVALISADTYRIGAIEQLRTFAAIADIPMEVAYTPAELAPALRKFRDKDIVFMDTVGRSQKSKKELTDLSRFLAAAAPDEIHLVLSASTSVRTANDIVRQFKVLKPNRVLFSKLDEAATLGPLLTVANANDLPVSYVTTGQTVPDDILSVDPRRMASMIFTGEIGHA
jgi:flagellar biosynthesis protein FlhF